MQKLIAWFVDNPVAANLLMFMLIVSGLLGLVEVRKEEFPNIEVPAVVVTVPYLGAAPAEVESGVCTRIEEAIQGIEGIDKVKTTAAEGQCTVAVELIIQADPTKALDDIKAQVNAITSFPASTERPIVAQVTVRSMVMQLAIHGDTDERSLKRLAEEIREDLLEIPSVSLVDTVYVRPDEISIELDEVKLKRHQLTMADVSTAIQRSSVDIPGGLRKSSSGDIRLRSTGQRYTGTALEDVVVIANASGTRVVLGEIATIVDGFEERDQYASINGERAQMLQIWRIGADNTLEISRDVIAYIDTKVHSLPKGISLTVWRNEGDDLIGRLGTMIDNALGGLILVIITLSLFLRVRLALWVTAGIPVSILGAIALFPSFGLGISTLSLMGFLLSLGVLVDDAIVIGERIYTREQLTNNPRSAAVMGTSEVAVPVFFGVLTTMAAFIPVVSVDSMLGQFFGAIGWTVILCLLFSLIESQLILPAHLAHRRRSRGKTKIGARWEAFQDRVVKSLENFATGRYKRWLILGLQYRHITLSIALAIMVVMGGMLASGRVLFQFFPSVAGDLLIARLVLPEGYPIEETKTLVAEIQAAAATLDQEMTEASPDGESAIVSELVSVGMPLSVGSLGNTGQTGSHIAEIGLNLKPHRERQGMTPTEAAARWRALTPALPDVVEQSFTAAAVSLGPDINLELRGRDIEVLGQAAHEISEILGSFDGIFDITDSYRAGKQEYTIKVRPEAESLGLTQADLGNQVRHAFYGSEAQRVQRGRDDVRIMVRYPRAERTSLSAFENMFVRLPDDTEVPLLAVASIAMSEGNATIQRTDGQRTISVTAYANRSVVAPESILAQMEREHLTDFQNRYPNVSLVLAGEAEERASALDGLARTSVLALIVIYSLLAVPLKSYTQPLVVMTSIPFGFIGAVVGHYLMGYDLVFFSLLGMVALSGVVINSSLVLVDFINRNKRTPNMSVFDAVVLAGTERFRPIFLTSVTTFVGLIPLMFNADLDTAPFVPLAVSLGFGVIFATTVTLILIPTLYLLLEDIHTALGIKTHKELPQESPY